MGFVIKDGVVLVDHSHNKFAVTTVKNNPTNSCDSGLTVHSAFLRTRTRIRKKRGERVAGDNCPFIYALKAKDGLTTTMREVHKLNLNLIEIIGSFLECSGGWEMIIPLPSSHNISRILANRLHRPLIGSYLYNDLLRKKNILEARAEIKASGATVEEKRYFENQLRLQRKLVGWAGSYSLKNIEVSKRGLLGPLVVNKVPKSVKPSNILLVDDVMSSRTTLCHAKRIVQELYPEAKIEAFCLFSTSGGTHRRR